MNKPFLLDGKMIFFFFFFFFFFFCFLEFGGYSVPCTLQLSQPPMIDRQLFQPPRRYLLASEL